MTHLNRAEVVMSANYTLIVISVADATTNYIPLLVPKGPRHPEILITGSIMSTNSKF